MAPTASARDLVQLESSYLGDGLFEYRVTILSDPFLASLSVEQLFVRGTWTGPHALPADWKTNAPIAGFLELQPTVAGPLNLPWTRTFRLQSNQTTFKRHISGLRLPLGGQFATNAPIFSGSSALAAIASLPALIPCPPAEADGSETNSTSRFETFRNPVIQELGLIDGEARFLTLTHQGTAYLRLESSTNLTDWLAVTHLRATNGVNRWTNSASLGEPGSFFRLLHTGPNAPGP